MASRGRKGNTAKAQQLLGTEITRLARVEEFRSRQSCYNAYMRRETPGGGWWGRGVKGGHIWVFVCVLRVGER